MKRITTLLLCVFAILSQFTFSQNLQPNFQNPSLPAEECGSDAIHQDLMLNDPGYKQRMDAFTEQVQNSLNSPVKVQPGTYQVPVVVHVMSEGTALTDISNSEIQNMLQGLNDRYRKVPGSLGDGGGVDTDLEFVLAVRDPSGNCTNGIVRYDLTGNPTYVNYGVRRNGANGLTDAFIKGLSFWNSTQYYNIWLVSEIDDNNGGSGIQGYAYFAGAHGSAVDGGLMLVNSVKNPGGTTLAHEMGHAFNLYHTFEGDAGGGTCPANGNCNVDGDEVCDTPPHMRSTSNCVTATNTCTGGSSTEHNVNYMDYSSDACQSEFTAGQKVRIINAITTTRSSFLQVNGNMSLVPPTTAGVGFKAESSVICIGNPIQFLDTSSCIPNTFLDTTSWTGISFNWTFTNGGTVYNSTLQNPIMNLAVAGTYDVSLSVTNGFGTTSHTENGYVTVSNPAIASCIPTTNNAGNFGNNVQKVVFNSINNSTSTYVNVAHEDFTCSANTTVLEGSTYPMEIDIIASGSDVEVTEVYIDYNNNGTFEAGELVLSGATPNATSSTTVMGNVVIPNTAVTNTLLRMRVFGEAGSLSNNERNCTSSLFIGDVEDYGVVILPSCTNPNINVQPADATICLSDDATFEAGSSGSGTYTYQWNESTDGGATWNALANGGIYSGVTTSLLTLTSPTLGANGNMYQCVITSVCNGTTATTNNATLTVQSTITITAGTITSPTVCGGNDGSIVVTGTGTGIVSWTGAATGNSGTITLPYTITGLTAGAYDISFAGDCSSNTLNETINDPGSPAAPTVSVIDNCGSSDLTAVGTDLVWSTTETTATISVNTPGVYTVTQTVAGCTSAAASITAAPMATPAITIASSNVPSACGASDGDITIGGTGTGVVTWTGPSPGNSGPVSLPYAITGLPGGSYSITFDDNCPSNTLVEAISDPAGTTSTTTEVACTDYTWNGTTYSATGIYTWTGTNAVGCDSIATLDLTINLPSTSNTSETACTDFTWNGTTYNTTGIYTWTGTNAVGCDSIATLDLTIVAPTTSNSNEVVCDTYTWNGTTYTTTGMYTWTGTNATGCDSIATLDLTVNASSTSNTVESACDMFTWNGTTYNTTGIYTWTGTNAAGCDSIATLDLTINSASTSNTVEVVCGDYTWNGTTYSTTGIYTWTGTNTGGCDSIATLDLTVNMVSTSNTLETACDTYTWNGTTYNTSGIYTWTGTNAVGCDSIATLDLTVNTSSTSNTVEGACDTYTWNGTTYNTTGIYTWTGTNANGCDSIATLDLTINSGSTSNTVEVVCGVYTWNGITYNTAGIYTWTGTNANGCDSIATLDLTVNSVSTSNTNQVSCTDYTWNGTTYNTSGIYTWTGTNAAGCDSIATLDLIINAVTTSNTIEFACDSYTWNGSTYNTSGIYTWTGVNALGCDSITTLDLTINTSSTSNSTEVACDSYIWNGTTYNTTGVYTWTGVNAVGCDSIATLDLTINTSSTSNTAEVACTDYTWNGTTYSLSGVYTWTGTNAAGCDSIATLDLTINSVSTSLITEVVCETYTWNGTTYTTSGLYSWTGVNAAGCDSIATLDLVVNSVSSSTTVESACDTYTWNGNTYNTSGSYTWMGTNANGCDSTANLNLTINISPAVPTISSGGVTAVCEGEDVVLTSSEIMGNVWSTGSTTQTIVVSSEGPFSVTYTDVNGCSSISAPFTMTINPTPAVSFNPVDDLCLENGPVTAFGFPAGGVFSGPGFTSGNPFEPSVAGPGVHTIYYTYVDGNGCTGVDTSYIEVVNCASVSELSEIELSVYPNPTNGVVKIVSENEPIQLVSIYDAAGRMVNAIAVDAIETSIDLIDKPSGTYNIRIDLESGVVWSKVIKL